VNPALMLLALLDLAFVALLPKIFFRSGQFNLRWLMTAAPFIVDIAVLALALLGVTRVQLELQPSARLAAELCAVPLCAGSIALIALTIGVHRVPLALWHQDDDAPRSIVTWGPYKHVRHPFYLSFLLGLLGTLLAFPHVVTLAGLAYSLVALNLTAAREERRLASSEFGAEYRAYLQRTGRFLPRLGGGGA
jgi:protein-S-isoprenylcysteine O-methyltransferase Ste14